MTRWALLLVVAACSSSPDRAAGKYQAADGRGPIFELRADGSLDIAPIPDPACADDAAAIAACRATQRWSRDGTKLTLRIGGISSSGGGSLGAMFAKPGPPCECRLEAHEATFDADTITIGKERAVRVR